MLIDFGFVAEEDVRHKLLCYRTRWHVSNNWQSGKFNKVHHSWQRQIIPRICLTKDVLWWSGGNLLSGFCRKRLRNSNYALPIIETILYRQSPRYNITKFVVRDEYIIGGYSDGSIGLFNRNSANDNNTDLHIQNAHAGKINSIDEVSAAIISGSRDGTVKLWRQPQAANVGDCLATINVYDKVRSLAADPTGTIVAVGSSGDDSFGDVPPFKLYDLECCSESMRMRHPWRRGVEIWDIVWEDPNVILTCGYDTTLRKWDTRTESCVAVWKDPTDDALYCLSSDHRFTVVTGTQYNCKSVLWDQRMSDYVQMYLMKYSRNTSSPIYGIAFDSSSLYGATDRCLTELTFTGRGYTAFDYRNIFQSM